MTTSELPSLVLSITTYAYVIPAYVTLGQATWLEPKRTVGLKPSISCSNETRNPRHRNVNFVSQLKTLIYFLGGISHLFER